MRLDRSAADRPVDLQPLYRSIDPIVTIAGYGDQDHFFRPRGPVNALCSPFSEKSSAVFRDYGFYSDYKMDEPWITGNF